MSDNVVYPPFPPKPGQTASDGDASPPVAGGGGGPHDPGMDARVSALEADMKDMKAVLGRMEPVLARVSEKLDAVATKEGLATVRGEVATLAEKLSGQDRRLVAVEGAIKDTIATALSKSLGAGAIIGLVAGIGSIAGALILGVAWALKHFNLS